MLMSGTSISPGEMMHLLVLVVVKVKISLLFQSKKEKALEKEKEKALEKERSRESSRERERESSRERERESNPGLVHPVPPLLMAKRV